MGNFNSEKTLGCCAGLAYFEHMKSRDTKIIEDDGRPSGPYDGPGSEDDLWFLSEPEAEDQFAPVAFSSRFQLKQ